MAWSKKGFLMKLSCQEGLAPGSSFAEKLQNLEKYGFEGVELNGSQLVDSGLEERRAALKNSSVKASSICGGYPAELVHPDAGRRRKCIEAYKRMLDVAGSWGRVDRLWSQYSTTTTGCQIFHHTKRALSWNGSCCFESFRI